MKIYVATDHAGFELKENIKSFLQQKGYEVIDCGAKALDPLDDYPDFIAKAAKSVSSDPKHSRAVILGGSGQGEAIVANKFPNVRAVVYYGNKKDVILLSREHNDANILSLGARFIQESDAIDAVWQWLKTPFLNEERHKRRISKIQKIESSIIKEKK